MRRAREKAKQKALLKKQQQQLEELPEVATVPVQEPLSNIAIAIDPTYSSRRTELQDVPSKCFCLLLVFRFLTISYVLTDYMLQILLLLFHRHWMMFLRICQSRDSDATISRTRKKSQRLPIVFHRFLKYSNNFLCNIVIIIFIILWLNFVYLILYCRLYC